MSQGKPRKEYLERIKKEEIEEGTQKTLLTDNDKKTNKEAKRK